MNIEKMLIIVPHLEIITVNDSVYVFPNVFSGIYGFLEKME